MDATVTTKFFRVEKPTPEAPNLEVLLASLFERDRADRETTLDEGIVIRLERLEPEGNFRTGEFCRIQRTNIPPSAGDDGLTPTVLEDGKGLGHLAAFRYHVPTRLLLLQVNRQCATPNRIALYLSVAEGKPLYILTPVLRSDIMARVKKAEIREFSIKFAEPENIEALDDERLSAIRGVRRAAKLLHGYEIAITVSAGRSKKRHMNQLQAHDIVKALSEVEGVLDLQAAIMEDEKLNWVDLLEEQMKQSAVLELPSDDPDENFEIRKRFITGTFSANLARLVELYGPKNVSGRRG